MCWFVYYIQFNIGYWAFQSKHDRRKNNPIVSADCQVPLLFPNVRLPGAAIIFQCPIARCRYLFPMSDCQVPLLLSNVRLPGAAIIFQWPITRCRYLFPMSDCQVPLFFPNVRLPGAAISQFRNPTSRVDIIFQCRSARVDIISQCPSARVDISFSMFCLRFTT
jgi:hypothetical protein